MDRGTQIETGTAGELNAPTARFGLLLSVLIASYLLSAFTTGKWIEFLEVLLFSGAALLALQAVLEALIGQVFLSTLVARLVAAYRGPRER